MAGTRRSTRRSTATQPFSPTSEAKRPQLKSRATPRRSAPKSASKSRSPSPKAVPRSPSPKAVPRSPSPKSARRSPSPASSFRTADSYVTPSEFSSLPAAEWQPSILGLSSTDLLSVAICAFIGGRYVYTHDEKLTGPALHASAAASAWLTAFGGGLIYHTMITLATMGVVNESNTYLRNAFAPGTLGFQQKPAIVAALVGFAASVPTGHPYDALLIDKDIFMAMDCLNWGILVGWAVSKLAVLAKEVPSPPPLVLLVIAFPAGYAYCAAGGMMRNLLFTATFTPSVGLPTNLKPGVVLPMAFGFAAYAVILQLVQSILPPVRFMDPMLGIPAVAYIFYSAATYLQLEEKEWDAVIDFPELSFGSLLSSGGDLSSIFVDGSTTSHPAATVLLTPILLYLVAGLRR